MDNPVLVIDADPAVYQAAFSAQKSEYHVVYETKAGELRQRIWSDGNKKLAFFRRHKGCVKLDDEKVVVVESPDHARQAAATIFHTMIKKVATGLKTSKEQLDVEVYLSGPDNFRGKLATITPYKALRADPPEHYNVVRNYYVQHWNGIVVHNWEADDQTAIRVRELQSQGRTVVLATIDKDLDQVAGLHYDYRQHVFYDVDPYDAVLFFWEQVLSGDSTDTIQGIPKVGPGKAKEWISDWVNDPQAQSPLDAWLWKNVVAAYKEGMQNHPDKFPEGMTPEEAALENARLVFMLEREGQLWTPPGVPDEEIQIG